VVISYLGRPDPMTGNTQNQDKAITAEAQNEAAQPSDAKAEAKVGDELSEDDLKAVAGGIDNWKRY
jgi:hypothetical protein